jgi:hypothetical protein
MENSIKLRRFDVIHRRQERLEQYYVSLFWLIFPAGGQEIK